MARSLSALKENVPQPAQQILDDILLTEEPLVMKAQSADPADPAAGYGVLWLSDGTGTGSEGDLIFKWRDAADTTTTTETITKA